MQRVPSFSAAEKSCGSIKVASDNIEELEPWVVAEETQSTDEELESNQENELKEEKSSARKIVYAIVAIILTAAIFAVNQKGIVLLMNTFLVWVESIGFWGNIMFCLMFILISFPFILGGYTPLTLGAGALYGITLGTITVSIGSSLGAALTFWLSRAVARKWVESKLKDTKEFRLFMNMLQGKNQFIVTLITRMAPIPFGLQNSFFALTDISFRDYMFSTWIGLLPFQIIWTHFGTTLRNLSKISSGEIGLTFWQKSSLFLQVVLLLSLLAYFFVLSKRMRSKQDQEENDCFDIEQGISDSGKC